MIACLEPKFDFYVKRNVYHTCILPLTFLMESEGSMKMSLCWFRGCLPCLEFDGQLSLASPRGSKYFRISDDMDIKRVKEFIVNQ